MNWSCAYDSSVIPLFYALQSSPMSQQPYFQNQGSMHSTLSDLLQHMPSTPTTQDLELLWRNHIWQNLHHSNPSQFLPGPNLTAIMEVCNALTNRSHPSCSTTIHCSSCLSLDTLQLNYNFPDFLDHNTFHCSPLLQGVTNLPPFTDWECTTFSNWINGCMLVLLIFELIPSCCMNAIYVTPLALLLFLSPSSQHRW